jgi:hypothetical protein
MAIEERSPPSLGPDVDADAPSPRDQAGRQMMVLDE